MKVVKSLDIVNDYIEKLEQENKQLKEQLENDIDRYEDTISYQLGFDKGKEKYYQALLDIKEYIESNLINHCNNDFLNDIKDKVDKALGDKEEEIKKYINSNDFIYDKLYKKREKILEILGDKE